MKNLSKLVIAACMAISLTGCVAAAIGAAAGGAGALYVKKNYNVDASNHGFSVEKKHRKAKPSKQPLTPTPISQVPS
jgi:hypothetical protein